MDKVVLGGGCISTFSADAGGYEPHQYKSGFCSICVGHSAGNISPNFYSRFREASRLFIDTDQPSDTSDAVVDVISAFTPRTRHIPRNCLDAHGISSDGSVFQRITLPHGIGAAPSRSEAPD